MRLMMLLTDGSEWWKVAADPNYMSNLHETLVRVVE